jgi:antitoxin YefM
MNAITYSNARAKLAETMDRVFDDHAPVIITRKSGKNVVLLSLEDYEGWQETAYLLRSPKNAKRLLRSIEQAEKGLAKERKLVDA